MPANQSKRSQGKSIRNDACFNPFNLTKHSRKKTLKLRKVNASQLHAMKIPVVNESLKKKICDSCRLRINKLKEENDPVEMPGNINILSNEDSDINIGSGDTSKPSGESAILQTARVEYLNQGLSFIGSSPISKKKLKQKRYSEEKIKKITEVITKNVFNISNDGPDDDDGDDDDDDDMTIVRILQESFNSTDDCTQKIKILTIFRHWSYKKIVLTFPTATCHMITVAKNIANEKGILSDPSPKSHPSLNVDDINAIISFYQSDDNTQLMPGKKDYISVKVNGQRIQMQKRLLLNNLKELFQLFKETYPAVKCSFSKFANLRPKHCILAGASGTHSVCVCPIHENVKLLIDGANLKSITADLQGPISNYHDCVDRMLCKVQSTNCFLGLCNECPGVTNIIEQLEKNFEDKFIETVNYKQWVTNGASGQYKNKKNFINLTHHFKDFKMAAEWHFFPTSHGKGPCDGVGGTLKRLAARASLQRVNNPIRTPKELFDWARSSTKYYVLLFNQ